MISNVSRKVLSTLLIVSSSFAVATPSASDVVVQSQWRKLINEQKNDDPGVCPDFPNCPPPLAPEEDPTSDHADK